MLDFWYSLWNATNLCLPLNDFENSSVLSSRKLLKVDMRLTCASCWDVETSSLSSRQWLDSRTPKFLRQMIPRTPNDITWKHLSLSYQPQVPLSISGPRNLQQVPGVPRRSPLSSNSVALGDFTADCFVEYCCFWLEMLEVRKPKTITKFAWRMRGGAIINTSSSAWEGVTGRIFEVQPNKRWSLIQNANIEISPCRSRSRN